MIPTTLLFQPCTPLKHAIVLHTVFFTFFMVLTRKICVTSKSELLLLAIISFSFVTLLIDLTAMFTTGEIWISPFCIRGVNFSKMCLKWDQDLPTLPTLLILATLLIHVFREVTSLGIQPFFIWRCVSTVFSYQDILVCFFFFLIDWFLMFFPLDWLAWWWRWWWQHWCLLFPLLSTAVPPSLLWMCGSASGQGYANVKVFTQKILNSQ